MEIIGTIVLTILTVSFFGTITAVIFPPPSSSIDNYALLPTLKGQRLGADVYLFHCSGKTINKCILMVNGLKKGVKTDFKIGDELIINNVSLKAGVRGSASAETSHPPALEMLKHGFVHGFAFPLRNLLNDFTVFLRKN